MVKTEEEINVLFDEMMEAGSNAAKARTRAEIKRDRLFAALIQKVKCHQPYEKVPGLKNNEKS